MIVTYAVMKTKARKTMSRYIDADELMEIFQDLHWYASRNIVEDIPTADVVEVVRCKDCKHSKMADYIPAKCPYFCKLMANCHSGDFFCSMGERREDD